MIILKYIGLGMLWVFWAAFHSLMLSDPVKKRLRGWFGWIDCHWRFFYCLVAVISISPLALLTFLDNGPVVVDWPWTWPLLVANVLALAIGWIGLQAFGGGGAFMGLSTLIAQCEPLVAAEPVQTGILGWIRHPLYLSALILLWAHDMEAAPFTATVVLTVYLFWGTYLEEQRLEKEWGQSWAEYRRRVSAFVPVKKLLSLAGLK